MLNIVTSLTFCIDLVYVYVQTQENTEHSLQNFDQYDPQEYILYKRKYRLEDVDRPTNTKHKDIVMHGTDSQWNLPTDHPNHLLSFPRGQSYHPTNTGTTNKFHKNSGSDHRICSDQVQHPRATDGYY